MDIASIKTDLIKNCNFIIDEYLGLTEKHTLENNNLNKKILELVNQNKLQLTEINELNVELKDYKKKSYDYEIIINELQNKLNNINEEKSNDPSIIRIQANSIHEKDNYIEQLLQKISFLQNELLNIKNMRLSIEPKEPETEPEPKEPEHDHQ